jgi:hypothetical protein
LLFGDGDDARAQSVRIILFALLDVVGSLMFVAGCVLYYPAYEDSCPEDWACIMIGAELFVVGSGLFMIGAGSNLYHDCWTAGGVGRRRRLKPPGMKPVFDFAADLCFVLGSFFFMPAETFPADFVFSSFEDGGVHLVLAGSALFAVPALQELRTLCSRAGGERPGAAAGGGHRDSTHDVACCVLLLLGCTAFGLGCIFFHSDVSPSDSKLNVPLTNTGVHSFLIGSVCFLLKSVVAFRESLRAGDADADGDGGGGRGPSSARFAGQGATPAPAAEAYETKDGAGWAGKEAGLARADAEAVAGQEQQQQQQEEAKPKAGRPPLLKAGTAPAEVAAKAGRPVLVKSGAAPVATAAKAKAGRPPLVKSGAAPAPAATVATAAKPKAEPANESPEVEEEEEEERGGGGGGGRAEA